MSWLNRLAQTFLGPLSDRQFTQLQFYRYQGRFANLDAPATFNEKIQWLKLHYRDPLLPVCADKYSVRPYVKEKAGDEVLVPLLGAYRKADEIDFAQLPERFVIKATHGSGWNLLVRDKAKLDTAAARKTMAGWLGKSFAPIGREWAYSQMRPGLIAESFLAGPTGEPPFDYKFFCFHGTPRAVQVDADRFTGHSRALYDAAWNRLPCDLEYPRTPEDTPPPVTLERMLEVAALLAAPFPFVRVDLYENDGRVYFGELTFTPGKGVERFTPREWDARFGKWLDMDRIDRSKCNIS